MKKSPENVIGIRTKTEHTTELNKEAMETLRQKNTRGVGALQLEMLTKAVESVEKIEEGIGKLNEVLVLLDDPEKGQTMRERIDLLSSVREDRVKDLTAAQERVADFYSSIIRNSERTLPNGEHFISSAFEELSRRSEEIWAGNSSFGAQMEQLGIHNTVKFIELLGAKELPLKALQAFLSAESQRFETEQTEMREVVLPIVDEFQTEITSERAKKYVKTAPDVLERRIRGVDITLLDSLDPAHERKSGHYDAREFGIRSDQYRNSKQSSGGKKWLRHIVFHELVHVTDGSDFLQITKEYTDPDLAEIIPPTTSVRQRKSGISFRDKASWSINEARVELLAAFLGKTPPFAYEVERMAFWELIDAGVSLDAVYSAASEDPNVYAPAGEKAPQFTRLAKEMSQFYGGAGGFKRFWKRVEEIRADDKLTIQSIRDKRALPM